ncbi:hypothetical protein DSTSK_15830 [Desulforhabdus sp. TSK]|nr:molybdopterin-dependent oxidoreductase [Desulforhabdus sp. TSK]GKT08278.1 hypothetical protein DSTSK_15830 [Desulforhabdus sp. TSK]
MAVQNGTSFYYMATDHWRYENLDLSALRSPVHPSSDRLEHPADFNVLAARLGWLPSYPQFNANPLKICEDALADGAADDASIKARTVEKLRNGDLKFAVEDPCHPANIPRILFLWRANLLGASGKGHEYFLDHLLGADHAVMNEEALYKAPETMTAGDASPHGKLDLLVTTELRMSTSALYADIVLPAAGWYEMHDLSTTDMHPFIHPFNPAIDPPWETKTNWDQFKAIAKTFSHLAEQHLGQRKDLVATPLLHDSPGERGEDSFPYADGPGPLLSGSRLDAAVRGRASPLPASAGHARPRIDRCTSTSPKGQGNHPQLSDAPFQVKPTQMIGGYAQLSYGFNYYGPTGAQRDEVIIVRKAEEVNWYEG